MGSIPNGTTAFTSFHIQNTWMNHSSSPIHIGFISHGGVGWFQHYLPCSVISAYVVNCSPLPSNNYSCDFWHETYLVKNVLTNVIDENILLQHTGVSGVWWGKINKSKKRSSWHKSSSVELFYSLPQVSCFGCCFCFGLQFCAYRHYILASWHH